MERKDVILLMKYIEKMYNSFRVDEDKITVWADFFKHEDPNEVMAEYRAYTKDTSRKSFPPNAPDLLPPPPPKMTLSEYERLEGEKRMLELQEYHETENVMPMPEWLKKKFEQRYGADFGGEDE